MKRALVIIALVAASAFAEKNAPQVIAADSNGVVVQVKEKYGSYVLDTCTVVMLMKGQFVLVHREGGSSWYPTSFHSVQVLESLGDNQAAKPKEEVTEERQPLAMATR
jgi:hypothetical protein